MGHPRPFYTFFLLDLKMNSTPIPRFTPSTFGEVSKIPLDQPCRKPESDIMDTASHDDSVSTLDTVFGFG